MYLIIGGSSDIGYKIASELANTDDVLLTYRNVKNLKKINNNKYNIIYKKLDLKNFQNIRNFVSSNKKILKNIKFINLATITSDKMINKIQPVDLLNVFKINIFSNILFCKELLPIMLDQNYGRFVFFTSTRASRGDVGISLYSASKEGLAGFSRCLAKEYSRFDITSNCLKLGYFNTKLFKNISNRIKNKLLNEIPSKKLGDSKNISNAIKTIVDSNYINGSIINIDGGI